MWIARVPELETEGAAAWGHTKEDALQNMQEVLQMIVEVLIEDDKLIAQDLPTQGRTVIAIAV